MALGWEGVAVGRYGSGPAPQLLHPEAVEGLVLININPRAKGWVDWVAHKVGGAGGWGGLMGRGVGQKGAGFGGGSLLLAPRRCGSLGVACGSLWVPMGRRGSLWVAVGGRGSLWVPTVSVGGCGSLRVPTVLVGGCGSLWVPTVAVGRCGSLRCLWVAVGRCGS
ncbi:hypothetical protein FK515_28625, partial [Klebsiella pneumoniae]|nr:hypothetical protein [Klebsiella pneumoniae]